MAKKYLVTLKDFGGDDAYFVVGEATYKWFDSPRPFALVNGKSGAREQVPAEVIAETTLPKGKVKIVEVTSGSCENDRAIQAMEFFEVHDTPPSGKYDGFWNGMIY
jgi:hypothetical protein